MRFENSDEQHPFVESGVQDFEGSEKSYAEFGQTAHGLNIWGDVKMDNHWLNFVDFKNEKGLEGHWLNIYTSPEIINQSFTHLIVNEVMRKPELRQELVVVDAGGYDGFLLNTVVRQLGAAGIVNVRGVNIDADPKDVALPAMERKIEEEEYSAKLKPLKADIVEGIPLEPESVDVVISRCAIQYSRKEQHLQFVKNIAKVLREGGVAVLQFPGTLYLDQGEIYTKIHREISEVITDGKEFQRDFPDSMFLTRFMHRKDLQEEVGLKALFVDTMREWPMSPESWGDRFSLDETRIEGIRQVYQRYQKERPDLFEEIDGTLCLVTILERAELRKISTQSESNNETTN